MRHPDFNTAWSFRNGKPRCVDGMPAIECIHYVMLDTECKQCATDYENYAAVSGPFLTPR